MHLTLDTCTLSIDIVLTLLRVLISIGMNWSIIIMQLVPTLKLDHKVVMHLTFSISSSNCIAVGIITVSSE